MSGQLRWTKRWPFRIARTVLVALGAWCLILVILGMAFSDRFLFYPTKYPEGSWDQRDHASIPIQEVEVAARDGTKLVAWYARPPNPRATFLFFHGNAGNVSDRLSILEQLATLGIETFAAGYRGYGKSGGTPSSAALPDDAESAYHCVTQQYGVKPDKLILFGKSLGGAAAVHVASRNPCAGLIVQSSFTSVKDMASKLVPYFPIGVFMGRKLDNLSAIATVKVPTLVIHGKADEIIPFEQGVRLFEAAPQPKWFAQYDDADHNGLISRHRKEWQKDLGDFVGKCVK